MRGNDTKWHSLSIDNIYKELGSSDLGLDKNQYKSRRQKYGPNKIPGEKRVSSLSIFFSQFKNPLIYILLIASIISLFLEAYTDAVVIAIAVAINTIIGYIQENKASKALDELKKYLKLKAEIIRSGHKMEVLQEEIVPGDILVLNTGDKVSADARLISSEDLEVNEAPLTGESKASHKNAKLLPKNTPLADRSNMVYMGTVVEAGEARAIVCATGSNTEFGKVATMIKNVKDDNTPFQKKLAYFGKILGLIVVGVSILIFIGGYIGGISIVEMFTTSVAVAVAAIPEGLPIAITVIFAIGMQKILKKKGLVRKLISAETLGTTTVICADKTGTLTEAKMKLVKTVSFDGEMPIDRVEQNRNWENTTEYKAMIIGALRSDAYIDNNVVRGRPDDKALLEALVNNGKDIESIRKKYPKVDEVKYKLGAKTSSSIHKDGKNNIYFEMGAPEIILRSCKHIESNDKKISLDSKKLSSLTEKYEKLTSEGFRVMAVSFKETKIEKIKSIKKSDMVFVGFLVLEDPLRSSAKDAISTCRNAGIKPIIITGDHRLTAQSIAKKINLPYEKNNIIEGDELKKISDDDLKNKINDIYVYARTEPSQKLRIIKAWQDRGEVVAMTGDGINDAPALKQADIGIALGSGTQVAKEVSDLVLLKDDFSVIVGAVEQGRSIIDNVRKVMTYLLSDSFTEIVLIGSAIIFQFPLPVIAAQILWVNLIEDSLPAISLAFEPKENDIMDQKPESKDIPLFSSMMKTLVSVISVVTSLFLLGLFYWLYTASDYNIDHIRSVIFAGLAIDSLFYAFACKSLRHNIWQINIFSNLYLVGSFLIGLILLIASLYVPVFQRFLQTVELNAMDISLLLGFGLMKLMIIEFIKYIYIKRGVMKGYK